MKYLRKLVSQYESLHFACKGVDSVGRQAISHYTVHVQNVEFFLFILILSGGSASPREGLWTRVFQDLENKLRLFDFFIRNNC